MTEIKRFAGWMAVCTLALTVLSIFGEVMTGTPLIGWQLFFVGEFIAAGAIWLAIKAEERM